MSRPSGQSFRSGAALIALPLLSLVSAQAMAQELSGNDGLADISERPVVAMGGTALPQGGGLIRTFNGGVDPLGGGLIRTFGGDISPFIGRIRTFEGDVDPQGGGLIRTFEGDVDPFGGGLIRTFWGTLTPTEGELDPKIGRIRTFSDGFVPQSEAILSVWAAAEASGEYAALVDQLRIVGQDGAAQWGAAIEQQTGRSFGDGFLQPFLAKWQVDLSRPETLAGWSQFDRQRLMLDWYDNLLLFSGMDRVDHWMNAVNWTPTLTQTQGGGSRAVVGLVDFFAANDPDVRSKVVYSGGYQNVHNAHGAAVGSLIVASHDGKGVMGIAPRATIAAYNPFDASLTASWDDVKKGIIEVGNRGASVINLSLGVPGYTLPTDWRDVFRTGDVDKLKDKALYVIAAGNDGVVQRSNINMKDAFDSTFIVVGSVDPNGQISAFSNTPGTACLLEDRDCKNTAVWNSADRDFATKADYLKESGLLMNRFLVAPGEMILVSDGSGGVTRMSGTSFAAPLVSGAIALIHDRWPWLKKEPRDVAKIILESAQDLGAPGVDPVYGHGLLDVEAAQAPLDFGKLKYYLYKGNSKQAEVKVDQLRTSGFHSSWATSDMFFIAFEQLDSSERDFLIPLSSRLFGSSFGGQAFQEFAHRGLMGWLRRSSFTAGLTDRSTTPAVPVGDGWTMALRGRTETVASLDGERTKLLSSVELSSSDRGLAFIVGSGDGAVALGGRHGLAMSGDFNPQQGGANPLLGFASGDAHIATRFALADTVDLSFGLTRQDRSIEQELASGRYALSDRILLGAAEGYHAQATTARLDYRPASAVSVSVSYTRLAEDGAFLGVRSLNPNDFGAGTVSDGLTLAADARLGSGVSLFASATASRSDSQGEAMLGIDNALGTAFQAGIAMQELIGGADHLRLSLAQPLTVERGHANLSMIGVIDRETGEKGLITQRASIGAPEQRRTRLEAFYGADLLEGSGRLGLFGSAELRATSADIPALTAGGNLTLAF